MNEIEPREQLGRMVRSARLRKYGTVEKARLAAEVSRGAWDHVESGKPVKDFTLAAVERALDWPAGRAEAVLAGEFIGSDIEAAIEAADLGENSKAEMLRIVEQDRAEQKRRQA